jgi:aminoglycoside/choline kinase family phosphotransferase
MYARILRLYQDVFGAEPTDVLGVAADGSARSYHRLVGSDGQTVVGAVGPEPEENRAFWSYSRAFRGIGLNVPELFAIDQEAGVWLMEDLGDTTLFSALDDARKAVGGSFPAEMLGPYRRVVEVLPRFQVEGHRVVDYSVAYPREAFDRQSILWDLNYFKYHFLKLAHVPFREAPLERDFQALIDFLLEADTDHFLYRDFQSRNIMLRNGEPWFIDYQGGRRGALQYDLASLVYDAKADLPESARAELLHHYLDALGELVDLDRDAFLARYPGYVLVRILQAMGAYGYRGFFEQKTRFLRSVPYAARNIAGILERGLPLELPEVEAVFRHIVDRWSGAGDEAERADGLHVKVNSFSYRQVRLRLSGGSESRAASPVRGDDRTRFRSGQLHRGAARRAAVLGGGACPDRRSGGGLPGPGILELERRVRLHGRTAPVGVLRRAHRRPPPGALSRRDRHGGPPRGLALAGPGRRDRRPDGLTTPSPWTP